MSLPDIHFPLLYAYAYKKTSWFDHIGTLAIESVPAGRMPLSPYPNWVELYSIPVVS
jgi:hypothetical protein